MRWIGIRMKIGPAQIGALYGPWNGSPHHKPRKLPQGYPEAKRPPDNAGGLLQVTLCTKGNLGAGEGIRTLDPDLGKVVDRQFPVIAGHAAM